MSTVSSDNYIDENSIEKHERRLSKDHALYWLEELNDKHIHSVEEHKFQHRNGHLLLGRPMFREDGNRVYHLEAHIEIAYLSGRLNSIEKKRWEMHKGINIDAN